MSVLEVVRSLATFPLRRAFSLIGASRGESSSAQTFSTTAPHAKVSGKYDQPLLRIVAARPGVTVAQAAQQIGVPATALYPTIRRLENQGALSKRGRELHPA